ncbi:iron response transcriptional regulator IrrA [Brucella sp. BE17]|uniref:iron response transcriptional regulator IrrA n=1 Tax=Brucella sp. BE17 TaxID=3142977 RepID=UPI0031BADB9A
MLLDPDTFSHHARRKSGVGVRQILKRAGLRPTRQRLLLASLLFIEQHRHVTPDILREEVASRGEKLSFATVYNTLNQFCEAGLIRRISLNSERTYFDTDTCDHAHFYIANEDRIIDIPTHAIGIGPIPAPPCGYEVGKVDILIHVITENDVG